MVQQAASPGPGLWEFYVAGTLTRSAPTHNRT